MSKENKSKSDSEFSLRWAKKIRAINLFGGKCHKCGNNNIFQLEFHHVNGEDKEINVGNLLKGRWSEVELEMKKCILLCSNCHAELHYDRKNILKEKLLDMKGQKQCSECGYDKSSFALEFHHVDEENKKFGIARGYREDRWKMPLEKIIIEMDKCIVICRNCHTLKRIDLKRFKELKGKIDSKINGHSELNKPADREVIKKFFEKGYGVCRIAKEMGYSKSTISLIKKKMKI